MYALEFAVSDELTAGAAPFAMGMIIVATLITAVWLGMRIRDRELPPPRPDEQPHLPESGPVGEEWEMREEIELPHEEGRQPTPYEVQRPFTRRSKEQRPARWAHRRSEWFG